jgi:mannosyltransferase OCH1-like enzyme
VYIILVIKNNYDIKSELEYNIIQNSQKTGSDYIPKNIYQLIQNKYNIDPSFEKNIEYIKDLNPTWNHILYDDVDMIEYINKYYPNLLHIYNKINPKYGAARADFFRYLLMYREGGVYLDIKSAMKVSLDKILRPKDEYILSHWPCPYKKNETRNLLGEYQQWHIICIPNHPYLLNVINNVINNIENYDIKKDGTGKTGVLKVTGPIAYTNSIMQVKANHTIHESNEYIGLIYNNISKSHESLFSKTHYSLIKEPIILK